MQFHFWEMFCWILGTVCGWIPGVLEGRSSDLLPPVVHDDLPPVLVVVVLVKRPSLHLRISVSPFFTVNSPVLKCAKSG